MQDFLMPRPKSTEVESEGSMLALESLAPRLGSTKVEHRKESTKAEGENPMIEVPDAQAQVPDIGAHA